MFVDTFDASSGQAVQMTPSDGINIRATVTSVTRS